MIIQINGDVGRVEEKTSDGDSLVNGTAKNSLLEKRSFQNSAFEQLKPRDRFYSSQIEEKRRKVEECDTQLTLLKKTQSEQKFKFD